MSHELSSIEIEVYKNGKTHMQVIKGAFLHLRMCSITSIYSTQRVLVTPTLVGT